MANKNGSHHGLPIRDAETRSDSLKETGMARDPRSSSADERAEAYKGNGHNLHSYRSDHPKQK